MKCFGCSEVWFPEAEIDGLLAECGVDLSGQAARLDYLCREDFVEAYLKKKSADIKRAGSILVFSCGVGVQVISKMLPDKPVIPGCDTFYLSGFQGIRVQDNNCEQCGQCWMNLTGGICPITHCPKGLLNGPCGGTGSEGECEVHPEIECGWLMIYRRLKDIQKSAAGQGFKNALKAKNWIGSHNVNARDYSLITGKTKDDS